MSNEIQLQNNKVNLSSLDTLHVVTKIAEMMASAKVAIPKQFVGSVGDCAAIVMKSMQLGIDPYTLAQKTHFINGVIAYEAQLVSAIVESSGAIKGGFKVEYIGDWSKVRGGNWSKDVEAGLGVRVSAKRIDDDVPVSHELYLSEVAVRNSPLWKTKPSQQIVYLAQKQWSRIYTPSALLGIYSVDEIDNDIAPPKDITPVNNVYAKPVNQPENKSEVDALYDTLKSVAEQGIEYYQKAWDKLTPAQKRLIGADKHAQLKKIASEVNVYESKAENINDNAVYTYAEVMDFLIKAKDEEQLSIAESFIDLVEDTSLHDELHKFKLEKLHSFK